MQHFKSQDRDKRLFGTWKHISTETQKEVDYSYVLKADGTKVCINHLSVASEKEYFYTEGNTLFILDPGEGIKRNSSVRSYRYKLSDDGLFLKMKNLEQGYAVTWKRQKEKE
ncbi:MAG: hypothetical protein ACTTKZ_04550 [Bacteroides sp.]